MNGKIIILSFYDITWDLDLFIIFTVEISGKKGGGINSDLFMDVSIIQL